MQAYIWNDEQVESEIKTMLEALAFEYPLRKSGDGITLKFISNSPQFNVICTPDEVTIFYSRLHEATRGVGLALSNISATEQSAFAAQGIMLDCSRNAVIKVSCFKRWLRRLALLGYNFAMLYTEDTFIVPEEETLGYQRGAYTLEELREIDGYASQLGIEMVPCIQILGHMEQLIKWDESLGGTRSTLRIGHERVYQIIEHIISFWGKSFKSRQIHIGMDESWHETGAQFSEALSEYKFKIFANHLDRVNQICIANGYLHPMIWSDMYFNFSSKHHTYFDTEVEFSEELKQSIPDNVRLVYWDYYHEETSIYRKMIAKHRELGFAPVMGSGIRTTKSFWYDHTQTKRTVPACIEACKKEQVQDIFFTMWGDDGAFCDYDSALLGMTYGADLLWGGTSDIVKLNQQFAAICGGNYSIGIAAADTQLYFDRRLDAWAPYLLWDDPLLGLVWRYFEAKVPNFWEEAERRLQNLSALLEPYKLEQSAGDIDHIRTLAVLLTKKIQFRRALLQAYRDGTLEQLLQRSELEMTEAVKNFSISFRRQWRRRNKPEGLEIMQYRFAGLEERYRECGRLIREYLAGDHEALSMLKEQRSLPVFYLFHNCASATRSIFH